MKIFGETAFINAQAAQSYSTQMKLNNPRHMGPMDSPYFGSGNNIIALEKKIGAEHVTRAGTFEHAMLQALDKVSGAHKHASELQTQAIINPDSVDIHDVTMAQAQSEMALGITRNILSRLIQGWRDLINTR